MRFDEYFREHPVINGIAKDPSSGQAAVDDAKTAVADNAAQIKKQKEGEFETLNW